MDRLAAAENQPLLSVQALPALHGLVTAPKSNAPLKPLITGKRDLAAAVRTQLRLSVLRPTNGPFKYIFFQAYTVNVAQISLVGSCEKPKSNLHLSSYPIVYFIAEWAASDCDCILGGIVSMCCVVLHACFLKMPVHSQVLVWILWCENW